MATLLLDVPYFINLYNLPKSTQDMDNIAQVFEDSTAEFMRDFLGFQLYNQFVQLYPDPLFVKIVKVEVIGG
jgi:hypothetical protein